jgi:hypothetical protein
MIAVDTNILVYAHRRDSDWHDPAVACVQQLAAGALSWLVPWPCIHEFLAITTHPRIYAPASTLDAALRQVDYWLESPSLVVAGEADDHWRALRALAKQSRIAGPVFHDARVAAICQTHGVDVLWSADRDFSRFPNLRVSNPLVKAGENGD